MYVHLRRSFSNPKSVTDLTERWAMGYITPSKSVRTSIECGIPGNQVSEIADVDKIGYYAQNFSL